MLVAIVLEGDDEGLLGVLEAIERRDVLDGQPDGERRLVVVGEAMGPAVGEAPAQVGPVPGLQLLGEPVVPGAREATTSRSSSLKDTSGIRPPAGGR